MSAVFDVLDCAKKLEKAGFTREQAEVQAELLLNSVNNFSNNLATKTDIAEINARLRETELRLQKEMKDMELRLLKWQWSLALALAAIMARGFGWLGF